MTPKFLASAAVIALSSLLALSWLALGAPYSIAEMRFHHRLAKAAKDKPDAVLDLATLMPGDWELVCSSHCYDGPLHLKKYGRTFAPVSACHDGTWGLIFISSDGSYSAAAGDCRSSSVQMALNSCLPRASAILQRYQDRQGCVEFRNH